MKQSLYFVCADGGTIRFIIDIKEINFAFFHRYNNSKSDDPCATTFTLSFGGDLHTNFAETTSKVDTESGIFVPVHQGVRHSHLRWMRSVYQAA